MAAVFTWEDGAGRGLRTVGEQAPTRQLNLFETTFERNPSAGVSDPKPYADAFPVQTTLHAYLKMPAAHARGGRCAAEARQVRGVR